MSRQDEIPRVLRYAADIIANEGHTKHASRDAYGYCVSGAVTAAVTRLGLDEMLTFQDPWDVACRELEHKLGYPLRRTQIPVTWGMDPVIPGGLVSWNDARDTTAQDVIDLLMDAAKRFENE